MQITDKTLVVGVDIAKKVHFARAFGTICNKVFEGDIRIEFPDFIQGKDSWIIYTVI
jgi:hypothetical protein